MKLSGKKILLEVLEYLYFSDISDISNINKISNLLGTGLKFLDLVIENNYDIETILDTKPDDNKILKIKKVLDKITNNNCIKEIKAKSGIIKNKCMNNYEINSLTKIENKNNQIKKLKETQNTKIKDLEINIENKNTKIKDLETNLKNETNIFSIKNIIILLLIILVLVLIILYNKKNN